MNPLVSIVVPSYNHGKFLEEALNSVLNQSYSRWECIIVNDGSTDHTETVAKLFINKDRRFKYLRKENEGLSSARNYGISMALGEFILPLDADDKISPAYVKKAVEAFQRDNSLKIVYCNAEKFGDENGPLELQSFSLSNLCKNNMIFCSALFRKKDWEKVGGYDENMIYGYEDWEFWISILKDGGQVKKLEDVGFYYRVKSRSMLKNMTSIEHHQMYRYISIKHVKFFVEQEGSFMEINRKLFDLKEEFNHKKKSEKFVIDLFLQTFFGFYIFENRL